MKNTPSAKHARNEVLECMLLPSALGSLCIVGANTSVRAILPGVSLDEARHAFPYAELTAPSPAFQQIAERIAAEITQPMSPATRALLDVRGTPFQLRVWAELMRIPRGATASYTEVAHRLGQPRAVRAVAGACAANLHAVLIPCHRVLRADGGLSGYRWGVALKRTLLRSEGAA